MSHAAYRYGIVILILIFMIDTPCLVNGWSTKVSADGDYFSITRNSQTVMMRMQGTVSGSITDVEVTPSGRTVKNVATSYSNMKVNDVGHIEKVSAREGRIIKNDNTILFSDDQRDFYRNTTISGGVAIIKPHEEWPVIFISRNQIRYKGLGLNDFGYMENTYDKIGENSLYNKNFDKDLYINASLIRFNATVTATDYGLEAEILPTTNTDYRLSLNTSGITDLYFRILDSKWDSKHRNYPASEESTERYVGKFSIQRDISKASEHVKHKDEKDEENLDLPCLCQTPTG